MCRVAYTNFINDYNDRLSCQILLLFWVNIKMNGVVQNKIEAAIVMRSSAVLCRLEVIIGLFLKDFSYLRKQS